MIHIRAKSEVTISRSLASVRIDPDTYNAIWDLCDGAIEWIHLSPPQPCTVTTINGVRIVGEIVTMRNVGGKPRYEATVRIRSLERLGGLRNTVQAQSQGTLL